MTRVPVPGMSLSRSSCLGVTALFAPYLSLPQASNSTYVHTRVLQLQVAQRPKATHWILADRSRDRRPPAADGRSLGGSVTASGVYRQMAATMLLSLLVLWLAAALGALPCLSSAYPTPHDDGRVPLEIMVEPSLFARERRSTHRLAFGMVTDIHNGE